MSTFKRTRGPQDDRTSLMRCKKCGHDKQPHEFTPAKGTRTGLRGACKECERLRSKIYRDTHPNTRRRPLKYGLTQLEYDTLQAQQPYCQICESATDLVVDHDHSCCPSERACGKCVRGFLCRKCNIGLGCFRDSADLLAKAIRYLACE